MKKFSTILFLLATMSSTGSYGATVVSSLPSTSDYWAPMTMLEASDGNFYGTSIGVATDGQRNDFIFKLTKAGDYTKVASFPAGEGLSGATAAVGVANIDVKNTLIEGDDGYLYGVLPYGGASSRGSFFRVSTSGTYEVLKNFDADCSEPACPSNPVGQQPYFLWKEGSVVYGAASRGGLYRRGTVFKYSGGVFSVVVHFKPAPINTLDSMQALYTGYLVHKSGNDFYTYAPREHVYSIDNIDGGTLNKITFQNGKPNSLTALHTFAKRSGTVNTGNGYTNADGATVKWLHKAVNGTLYGETNAEGANGYGTVFKIDTNGFSIIRQNALSDWGQAVATAPNSPIQETSSGSLLIKGKYALLELKDSGFSIKEAACPDCFVVRGSDKKGYGFARSTNTLAAPFDTAYVYKWGVRGSFYTIDLPDAIPVEPTLPVSIVFEAIPDNAEVGDSVTLSWSSTNATTCEASGSWTGPKPTTGSTTFVVDAGDKNYVLTCSSTDSSAIKAVNIAVTDVGVPVVPKPPVVEQPAAGGSSGGSFNFINILLLAAFALIRKSVK